MSIVICGKCGAKNRVDERKLGQLQPVCGRCGAALSVAADAGGGANGHPIEITDATLADQVAAAGSRPLLVDCWAAWCGPCRMIAPAIDQLAAESAGRWSVAKLNVDENPRTSQEYHIDSIPTLLIFKNGRVVERLAGLRPKEQIAARLAAHA